MDSVFWRFFHRSSDSSTLSSLRPLAFSVNVITVDATSLYVASRSNLFTSSFSIPDVSHVPSLTNLFSDAQLADFGSRVIFYEYSCSF
jgi:hypothetical protein